MARGLHQRASLSQRSPLAPAPPAVGAGGQQALKELRRGVGHQEHVAPQQRAGAAQHGAELGRRRGVGVGGQGGGADGLQLWADLGVFVRAWAERRRRGWTTI
jgi:hypothetical protein